MLAAVLGASTLVAVPVAAQVSSGGKFLEAVRKKDTEAVFAALDDPGNTLVNTRDASTGDTPLHLAVHHRDPRWLRFLYERGANVNARNNRGETPLALASTLGFVVGVQVLLLAGARVDDASSTGETPLITATHRRDAALARILLKAGADPRRSDNSGRSARDYAQLEGAANPVLAEIESAAKARASEPKRPSYGPSL